MDFLMPPEDDPRRIAVREWLTEYPHPSPSELADAGFVAPHWPEPWGLGADPIHQLIIDEELGRAKVGRPVNPVGLGWAGPTILYYGTQAQKDRYLGPLLRGEEIWCQLFSEPDAGSDLASLGTRAVRDGDEYVVTGQKIWTSMAQAAHFGILLARTDPDALKHDGISYFICPMDDPGIEIRPVVEMTGNAHFNEVFLDEVRIPADNLVGEENRGWELARVTLGNERVSLSRGGALWGMGPTAGDLLDLVRQRGGVDDRRLRQALVQIHIEAELLRLIQLRVVTEMVHGRQPGPEASVQKIMADEHGQRLMNLAKDLAGAGGMLGDRGPLGAGPGEWHWGFLFSRALTVGGGTGQVLRNVVAERALGLPRDPNLEAGRSWAETRGVRMGA
ncbi:MAG: acyl-CoA dehydrogenase family protein [Acidimicrobiia bacterium]